MAKSLDEIKKEYMNLLVKAGDLQYKIVIYSKDLELVNNSLRDINLEASKFAEAEKQVAASATAQPSVPASADVPAQG